MNRSILIVICDFLLLSLLTCRFDREQNVQGLVIYVEMQPRENEPGTDGP